MRFILILIAHKNESVVDLTNVRYQTLLPSYIILLKIKFEHQHTTENYTTARELNNILQTNLLKLVFT